MAKKKLPLPPSERRARAKVEEIMESRVCGSCQACCEAVAVHEIGKPEYTPCEHQCAAGCGIYKKRPGSCRAYGCLWKAGMMPASEIWRPNSLGVIFDVEASKEKPYIRCWQLDSPTQIREDPQVRLAAYELAMMFKCPVLGYFQDEQRSVHLVAPLLRWRGAFEKQFPKYPVYELTPDLLL